MSKWAGDAMYMIYDFARLRSAEKMLTELPIFAWAAKIEDVSKLAIRREKITLFAKSKPHYMWEVHVVALSKDSRRLATNRWTTELLSQSLGVLFARGTSFESALPELPATAPAFSMSKQATTKPPDSDYMYIPMDVID